MKLLRIFLVIYACLYILGGILFFQHAKGIGYLLLASYLLINASAIIVGVLFEKGRYKAHSITGEGWQRTNERFVDQSSRKLMEVYYNPKTGERSYREVNSK